MSVRIKGFLETSFLDWPGKVSAVLFLPGCNFRCPFCHNHELWTEPEKLEDIPLQYILERMGTFRDWIDGVCITGGEPTLQGGLRDLILELRGLGLGIKLDTNGSHPEVLEELIEEGLLDFVAMDVKAPLDPFRYQRAAGVSVDLGSIRRSIEILEEGKVDYVFRITVVPGLHTEGDIMELASELRGSKGLLLQNFNPQNAYDPALRSRRPYPEEWLRELQQAVNEIIAPAGLTQVA
ncbi:MAG: anaerobic ribonucleoside-triphosphate reductase activating protein [Deltaproteobacteria bacterium]|nr:MAG: anaerobic ribonucleoside-triphosphate reductase activating protein [Deltaproteobacteria bacterium]